MKLQESLPPPAPRTLPYILTVTAYKTFIYLQWYIAQVIELLLSTAGTEGFCDRREALGRFICRLSPADHNTTAVTY
jgi:hypothetical protein